MAYPTVSGYDTELQAIVTAHPTICSTFKVNAPADKTHEGRDIFCLRIGPGIPFDPPNVLIMGGIHAREWAPPDALLTFARKLAEAYDSKTPMTLAAFTDNSVSPPIVYPTITLPFSSVEQIVDSLGVYIVPMTNPDGRVHSKTIKMWRKNKRPGTGACPPLPASYPAGTNGPIGVDPNRNFDITWDFEEYYNAAGVAAAGVSKDKCDKDQTYIGPSAASEPESRAIQKLINDQKVRWFMDVHSASRLVLHPWSMEINGNDPTQTFQDASWNKSGAHGGRDGKGGAYNEFVPDTAPEKLRTQIVTFANTIRDAILRCGGSGSGADPRAVTRSTYTVGQPLSLLYGVTGGSMDYAFSRQFVPGGWGPIYAFALECGIEKDGEGGFQPSTTIFPKIEREVHAAVFALLNIAANRTTSSKPATAVPAVSAPSTAPTSSVSSGGGTSCPFSIVSLGTLLQPYLTSIRHLRDKVLPQTAFGRRVARAADFVYRAVSPSVVPVLRASALARIVARSVVVAPIMFARLLCGLVTSPIRAPGRRANILAALLVLINAATMTVSVIGIRLLLRTLGLA